MVILNSPLLPPHHKNGKKFDIEPERVRDFIVNCYCVCTRNVHIAYKTNSVQALFSVTTNQESNNKKHRAVDSLEHANLTLHYI